MKAVVWTDVFQGVVLLGGLLAVMIVVSSQHIHVYVVKCVTFLEENVFFMNSYPN